MEGGNIHLKRKKLFRVLKKDVYVVFAYDPAFDGGKWVDSEIVCDMQRYFFKYCNISQWLQVTGKLFLNDVVFRMIKNNLMIANRLALGSASANFTIWDT